MMSARWFVLSFLCSLIVTVVNCKKCLIVNIDNRELSENINDNSYASMSAVINLAYARRHGYDFLYVQNVVKDFEKIARGKYFTNDTVPPTNIAKDVATAFHVGLLQFRAASWAKLPALWHVTVMYGVQYDYVWYIDSDACVSPIQINKSIEGNLREWESSGSYIRGNPHISKSAFVFFNNKPWRDDMPCAGL
jgi:hypothetical protein